MHVITFPNHYFCTNMKLKLVFGFDFIEIDLLQQALSGTASSTNTDSKTRTSDFVPWTKEQPKEEDLEKMISELPLSRENTNANNDTATASASICSDWSESFQKSFTGKLLEIQAMREKLESLQNLVHSIPTPNSNYQLQSLDNELEFEHSSSGCDAPKDV